MKVFKIIFAALAPVTLAQQQTLCQQYGYFSTNGYELNNNLWGMGSASSGSQCTYYDGLSGSGVRWHTTWTWAGNENGVKSYVYSGRQITKKLVSQINSMPTTVQWGYDVTNTRSNVAYDLFTAADINHSTSSGDYEIMIWLGRYGNAYPIGSSQGQVSIGGRTWELWYGLNNAMKVYSFIAPSPVTSFSGDLKEFFKYLANNKGFPVATQNLITFQFGTEAFTGGPATMTVSQWSAEAS